MVRSYISDLFQAGLSLNKTLLGQSTKYLQISTKLVYWFICTIKQDILQITVLYHVESPVDEPHGLLRLPRD